VAGITDPSGGADATTTLALVGSLGGRIALYEFAPAAKTARALPLDIKRPAHKYANAAARASSAGEDGESYSLHTHVHALLVVPLASSSRTHIVFAGEGRLLRVYALELGVGVVVASAPAKAAPGGSSLKHLAEFDVGEGGWVNCLARLHAPAGSRDAGQLFVGAGVAGLPHCVQVYACGSGSSLLAPTLHKTYPSRSDEMHGLDQLSDGRIVVGGCSGPVAGAAGGEEGGCVELWSWATGAVASSSQLLKHDLRVAAEIGLRCNGVQVLPKADTKSGGDQLLIAYEYCSTGARQMVLYTFDGAVDVSATQIEAKNMPSNDENTFTSVVVSARHPQKAVAMTSVDGSKTGAVCRASKGRLRMTDSLPWFFCFCFSRVCLCVLSQLRRQAARLQPQRIGGKAPVGDAFSARRVSARGRHARLHRVQLCGTIATATPHHWRQQRTQNVAVDAPIAGQETRTPTRLNQLATCCSACALPACILHPLSFS
jgi:hypothetical protein